MKKTCIILIGILSLTFILNTYGRENTTRKKLQASVVKDVFIDTIIVDDVKSYYEKAVTMRGYAKRFNESKETFMLINNTNLYLSQVELLLKYFDVEGVLLHERTELIFCDLPPYSSRQLSIKTFDEGRKFHYIGSKSGKGSVAYEISMRLLSYSVKIERK